ncbi:MAG: PilT/PilU family type 4a pilus ATPase [Candidatus Yanofskybacteria bacterium]|nr:PilT/PilU family type 4a pilus ATPase [Candidatus Yanofskybacteria bacterium]
MSISQPLQRLLAEAVRQNASDLHITVGSHPMLRIAGELVPLDHEGIVDPASAEELISSLLNEAQRARLASERQLDCAHSLPDGTRIRVNAYFQQNTLAAAMRLIPATIRGIDELNLPPLLHGMAKLTQGLILMVGPAGHGKSTTTAALLDEIARTRAAHIITIEDPIEHVFSRANGLVSQREVGADTRSFADGLRTVLRQDPDVIMVGEMRDAESIATAMTAAETGHLVISTLHTNSASQTIDRIIDTFPPEQQQQVVAQIAATLVATFSERLVPRVGGGRIPAFEIMVANPAVRNLIREHKIFGIDSVLQTGGTEGMTTLERSLAQLVKEKKVAADDAERFALNPGELRKLL